VVTVGLTGLVTVVLSPALLYHVNVPKRQVPARVLDAPVQILEGLALTRVGAVGNVKTITLTEVALLLQVPLTQEV
jgi:hypothetical protein